MISVIGTVIFLVIGSHYDRKEYMLPVWLLWAGAAAGILLLAVRTFSTGLTAVQEGLAGMIPGAALLALSFLTEKKVGNGDGIVLMILGLWEGGEAVFLLFCTALFFQALVAVALLLFKKADKQKKLPFIPFMLTARLVLLFASAEWRLT